MVCSNLSSDLYLLRSLANEVSNSILKTVYFATFHAHFTYAIVVWGHSTDMKRIFGLQRKAIRILSQLSFREECRLSFRHLGILTVPSVYIFENLIYIKSNLNNFSKHTNIHTYETRNRNAVVPIYWRLDRCQDGPGYWSIKFFNLLPESIQNLPF